MATLDDLIFHDEAKARAHLEALRWSEGRSCPHCGVLDKSTALQGKSHRAGLYQCNACREHFTVTVGTVMERSHIPLHKWVLGFHLMASSKKGMSSHQLSRMLGVGYKSAWFMAHRIREAMRSGELDHMGQDGGVVEADETYIGVDKDSVPAAGKQFRAGHKMKIVSLVERNSGRARSYVVDKVSLPEVAVILGENLSREAWLMTDQHGVYKTLGWNFAQHSVVDHGRDEWVSKTDPRIYTNTVEGYFSIFKRGMRGVYQHCGKQHLHRYLAEFDFRYSNRIKLGVDDTMRAARAVTGAFGKRLTYKAVKAA